MSTYNLGTASGRIEIDGKAGAAGFKVVETAANTFFDVVNRKVDSIESMGRKLRNAGAVGVGAFGLAVKAASDFETQMSGVQAVANGTEAEMESLREKAMQLGADTAFSASEAALALEELVKAGVGIEDVLNGAADGAVALAAAGGISLPEAATIAANAMNQFGLSADSVVGIADVLAGVANVSASEVGDIGQSLSQVGAVANLAGLSMRDTAIAIGEMSDAGITGSDAGTALKTMLNNLIPVSDRQTQKFKDLGLLTYDLADANKTLQGAGLGTAKSIDGVNKKLSAYVAEMGKGEEGTAKNTKAVQDLLMEQGGLKNAFFDSKGEVKELGALQGVLADATEGMTSQQKLASLEILFGADSMRAAAVMAKAGTKGYEEFSAAVADTSAAEVAEIRLDNLSGAAEAFGGSMETAMITVGNVFLPIVTGIVRGATAVINVFNAMPGPIKTAISVVLGIVSVMALLVGTMLASLTVIAAFVLQFYALRVIGIATGFLKGFIATQRAGLGIQAAWNAGLATASARTSRLAKVTAVASKAILLFSRAAKAAWLAMLGPLGIVIAIVIALGVALYALYKNFKPFRDLVNSVASSIKGAFLSAWKALLPMLSQAKDTLIQVGKTIAADLLPFLKSAASFLKGAFLDAFQVVGDTVKSDLLPAMSGLADVFKKDVVPAFQKIWEAVAPLLPVLQRVAGIVANVLLKAWLAFAKVMIGVVYPALIKVFGFLIGTFAKTIATVIAGVAKTISGLLKVFSGLITFVTGVLTGDWGKAWDGIKQIFSGFVEAVTGMLGALLGNMAAIVQAGFDVVVGWFKSKLGEADAATGGLLSSIFGRFVSVFSAIAGFLIGVFTVIKNIFVTYIGALWTFWSTIFMTFLPVLVAIWGVIIEFLKLVWIIIKGVFLIQLIALKTLVMLAFNAMKAAIIGSFNAVKGFLVGTWNLIKAIFSAGLAFIKSIWNAAWGAIVSRFGADASRIKTKVVDLFNKAKDNAKKGLQAITDFFKEHVQKWIDKVSDGVTKVVDKIKGLKDKALDAVSGFGTLLYDAGAALVKGLISGITSKLDSLKGAVGGLASKVKGFLPGSPVKEGPLTSWNRGGAGKRLVNLLADGLKDTGPIDAAMRSISSYVNGIDGMVKPGILASAVGQPDIKMTASAVSAPRATAKKGGGGKKSRLIEGELTIGPDGRVWIEGVAQDVYDENEEFKDNQNPKGGRRG